MNFLKALALVSASFVTAGLFSAWIIFCSNYFAGSYLGLGVALSPVFIGLIILLWMIL